jgi:hypothetical protein
MSTNTRSKPAYTTIEQIPEQFIFVSSPLDIMRSLEDLTLGVYISRFSGLFVSLDSSGEIDECYGFAGRVPDPSKPVTLLARHGRKLRKLPVIPFEEQYAYVYPPEYTDVRYAGCTKYVRVTQADKLFTHHHYHMLIHAGWYVWAECPGCFPEGDSAMGPFRSLAEAKDEWGDLGDFDE